MGIEGRKAVTRKVLADRRHARGRESLHDAGAEGCAGAVIEIEHRREAEIDAVRGKLRGDDVGGAARRLARRAALAVPPPTELAHRRDRGEAVAKPLYAPAFVIDADRQRRLAQPLDVLGERAQLIRILVIARKQDHGAHRRVPQALALVVGHGAPLDIEHHRPERTLYFSHSRITVARATPRSSERETCAFDTPRRERNCLNESENCRTGWPDGRFLTHTPCQLAGAWMPVPSALANASLAAKRLAR